MSYLFSENKWYLVSPLNDGNWSTVVNDWYAASNITGATFYRLIYKLKAPVTHGVALTNDNWESIDIDSSDPALEANTGYWVYVEQAATLGGGATPIADKSLVLDKANNTLTLKYEAAVGKFISQIQLKDTNAGGGTLVDTLKGSGADIQITSGTAPDKDNVVSPYLSSSASYTTPFNTSYVCTMNAPPGATGLIQTGENTIVTFSSTGIDLTGITSGPNSWFIKFSDDSYLSSSGDIDSTDVQGTFVIQ